MIFLLLDILIYNLTRYNSYFFLISLLLYKGSDFIKIIFIGLVLDLIILNVPFINTLIISLLFLINKKIFKLKKRTLTDYLLLLNFNYVFYNVALSILYSFILSSFSLSYIINILFYILSYNLVKKRIKLSR